MQVPRSLALSLPAPVRCGVGVQPGLQAGSVSSPSLGLPFPGGLAAERPPSESLSLNPVPAPNLTAETRGGPWVPRSGGVSQAHTFPVLLALAHVFQDLGYPPKPLFDRCSVFVHRWGVTYFLGQLWDPHGQRMLSAVQLRGPLQGQRSW